MNPTEKPAEVGLWNPFRGNPSGKPIETRIPASNIDFPLSGAPEMGHPPTGPGLWSFSGIMKQVDFFPDHIKMCRIEVDSSLVRLPTSNQEWNYSIPMHSDYATRSCEVGAFKTAKVNINERPRRHRRRRISNGSAWPFFVHFGQPVTTSETVRRYWCGGSKRVNLNS
jgi:hypothetical protein